MLGRRRRRWANIGPTLGRIFVFAGYVYKYDLRFENKISRSYNTLVMYVQILLASVVVVSSSSCTL